MRRIFIGADSAGFTLKEEFKAHLTSLGYEVTDCGCDSTASCHYPEFASRVCENVQEDLFGSFGILICGTGIGISIAANKVKGIRAALCADCFSAAATREHNNANILAMGARTTGPGLELKIVDTFLDTPFSNDERHIRRIAMIEPAE